MNTNGIGAELRLRGGLCQPPSVANGKRLQNLKILYHHWCLFVFLGGLIAWLRLRAYESKTLRHHLRRALEKFRGARNVLQGEFYSVDRC